MVTEPNLKCAHFDEADVDSECDQSAPRKHPPPQLGGDDCDRNDGRRGPNVHVQQLRSFLCRRAK